MRQSKSIEGVLLSYQKGYRIINGEVISPVGNNRKLLLNSQKKSDGRLFFTMKNEGNSYNVKVHLLVAYQKFGDAAFEDKIQVRHLDGNPFNNLDSNIDIGTPSENYFDRLPAERLKHSVIASTYVRKFTDVEMERIRNFYSECKSYKKTMEEFNITSSATLYYILKNKYQTILSEKVGETF
jgi:hypothetical protein